MRGCFLASVFELLNTSFHFSVVNWSNALSGRKSANGCRRLAVCSAAVDSCSPEVYLPGSQAENPTLAHASVEASNKEQSLVN